MQSKYLFYIFIFLSTVYSSYAQTDSDVDLTNLNSQLEQLKIVYDADSVELATKIALLDSLKLLSSEEYVVILRNAFDSLSSRDSELLKLLDESKTQIVGYENCIKNKKKRIEDFYREDQRKINLWYASLPFSQIKVDILENMINESTRYYSQEIYADYYTYMYNTLSYKKLYDRGQVILNIMFDKNAVNNTRLEIIPLLDKYHEGNLNMSEDQFAEMDDLDISLSRYKDGVKVLNDIINTIKSQRNEIFQNTVAEDREKSISNLKDLYLHPAEGTAYWINYKKYFSRIPYLKKTLDEFLDSI